MAWFAVRFRRPARQGRSWVLHRLAVGVLAVVALAPATLPWALAQGPDVPDGVARIHYSRPDGAYDGFELHVWEDTTESVTWGDGLDIAGFDAYGAYWDVALADGADRVGFIVHKGDLKDPGPDMFLELGRHGREIWLQSGSADILTAPPLGPPEPGTARIHYHRPDGAYDGFELHVWEDTTESVTWADGLDIAGTTDYGVYWTVGLADDARRVGFIVHRGDEKDPGPDMFLELDSVGPEIWLISGSATIHAARPDIRAAGSGDLAQARAHWVRSDTVAWDVGDVVPGTEFALHAASDGGLELTADGVEGGHELTLTLDPDGLPGDVRARFPHLANLAALRLDAADAARAGDLLRGRVAVSMRAGGAVVDATGVQVPGVLDDLYAAAARTRSLGATWTDGVPSLAVWAPTAIDVRLRRFDGLHGADAEIVPMVRDDATGIWTVEGRTEWAGDTYLYEVTVFAPSTGRIETNLVTDPYSVSLTRNSTRSHLVDLADPALAPPGWTTASKPPLAKPEDITIYEVHMRDFSVGDAGVPDGHQGTYLAFGHEASAGMRHLAALRDAGLSHLHLLPTFDLATIDEDPAARVEPAIAPIEPPSASAAPQAAVDAVRDRDAFNWGYDPWHYNVPEGSYSTDADGARRILEFRTMVRDLNRAGLRVVVDVVYNHTNSAGQAERSVLDRIVPGYYHRLDARGFVTTSTCCPNTATEHAMMEKLMLDSVRLWATAYRIDGFRFDLMGHHMRRNMVAVRELLDGLTLADDGVAGADVYVYGEGWNFGEVADNARGVTATQLDMGGVGIGTFSDRLRDAVRGGGCCPDGADLFTQGFGNGLAARPNAVDPRSDDQRRADLLLAADQIRVGLTGNLRDYPLVDRFGDAVTGADVPYFGQPGGYALDPQEVVTYVSKHDNQTLWDINAFAIPTDAPMADRVRYQQLGLSLAALSQGVPFFQAGSDLLRSKSLDRNSYNSGDWFNRVDFAGRSTAWGVGLPIASENRGNWQHMRPLLEDPALLPSPADIAASAERFRDWLRIRSSSELFRLATAEDVIARLAFHNMGPDQVPGVIVMSLSDDVDGAPDLDPDRELVVVAVNATEHRQTLRIPALEGLDLRLHAVQAAGDDPLLATAASYRESGALSLPRLTTAVFVLREDRLGTR